MNRATQARWRWWLAALAATVCSTAAPLAAQQQETDERPWLEKPPSEWKELERQQILTASPWARTIERIECPVKGRTYTQGSRRLAANRAPGGAQQADLRIYHGRAEDGRALYSTYPGGGPPTTSCLRPVQYLNEVSWESAQTVCRARQGAEACAQPAGEYVVRVWSAASAFRKKTEAEIRRKSYFETKQVGKTPPTRVQLVSDHEALFYFPRQTPQGQPLVAVDERAVTFVCACGWFRLKTEFHPRDMVSSNGPDI